MRTYWLGWTFLLVCACLVPLSAGDEAPAPDPYETYIKTSDDFKPVKQDKDWLYKAYPSWVFMPWYFHWYIGHGDEGGKWSVDTGYNGAFVDRGDAKNLDWIHKFKLRFYMDHTANKRFLHLWDGDEVKTNLKLYISTGMRPFLINDEGLAKLKAIVKNNIENVKSSPYRAAYALDDEISWGVFSKPCMWQITDDTAGYKKWLDEIYGTGKAPAYKGWISYEDIRKNVDEWSLAEFDAGQLIDQWTFNDSVWCNFLGKLVDYGNSIDPATPVGFVGGQSPGPFGYDYAKIMKKIQYIEAYDNGSCQAVLRSFSPHNAIPCVTSQFHKSAKDDIWGDYYYLAHGNRGHIGWVENWFKKDGTPLAWQAEVSPALKECGEKLGPLQAQAEWIHDGVAIYYSQTSIELGWILDATAHGSTWKNRDADSNLGSIPLDRHAWEHMLHDEGIQYNFISYADVIKDGIPKEYKVLILTGNYCLSDVEAARIQDFCKNGGTVIADFLPGCWDQHGRGRKNGGALDTMFGVKHNSSLKAADVFGDKGWWEVNQDDHYKDAGKYKEFLSNSACKMDASGFNKAVKSMGVNHSAKFGTGTAVLMNLSPQYYNLYREEGFDAAKKRSVFMKHVTDAGVKPRVWIDNAGAKEFGYEITYWKKDDRTIVWVVFNPELSGDDLGGGNSVGLKTDKIDITLKFAKPIAGVKDERAGTDLADGDTFKCSWKMNEAVVLSFKSAP